MAETDKLVQELWDKVQQKKAEITKAERPSWKTNCSFGFTEDTAQRINLQVTANVKDLVKILAFLIDRKQSFDLASSTLGVKVKFEWLGYSFEDWKSDLMTRATKIEISKKKSELETLESRLNALISPELKRQLELEAIKKELEAN